MYHCRRTGVPSLLKAFRRSSLILDCRFRSSDASSLPTTPRAIAWIVVAARSRLAVPSEVFHMVSSGLGGRQSATADIDQRLFLVHTRFLPSRFFGFNVVACEGLLSSTVDICHELTARPHQYTCSLDALGVRVALSQHRLSGWPRKVDFFPFSHASRYHTPYGKLVAGTDDILSWCISPANHHLFRQPSQATPKNAPALHFLHELIQ